MATWLMKSEPSSYSIDDLRRDGRTTWDGVRNYQARNHMRDMCVGDLAIFYHSNANPPGPAGIMRVVGLARPDPTAWDPEDHHFDARSTPERPLWDMVEVEFVAAFPEVVPLSRLAETPELDGMVLLSGKAMRLSIQPVTEAHFGTIVRMGGVPAATTAAAKTPR